MSKNSKRPKLLFILPLPPPVHGASLRNESLVNSRVLNEKFDIKVIPMHFIKDNSEMGKFSVLKVLKSLLLYVKVIFAIIFFRPKIVYFNASTIGFALYRDIIVILLSKAFGGKVVIHIRTLGIEENVKESKFNFWLLKWTYRNTKIICLSEMLSNDVKLVYQDKIEVVNNGLEYFAADSKNEIIEEVRFLFLSVFLKTKGIEVLIDAVEILKQKGFDFSVTIAGKDADLTKEEINRLVESKNLKSLIHVEGPVYGEEKFKLFQNSNVFVLPTTWEAFPGVILEAMQFEMPSISTKIGAIPEIIDDKINGFLVESGSSEELAKAMEYFLLNNHRVIEYGKQAKKKYLESYTIESFENRMTEVFHENIFK